MNNFITRILSGAVYVGLILYAVVSYSTSPYVFLVVFGIFSLIGVWEANRMINDGENQLTPIIYIDAFGTLAMFGAFYIGEHLHNPIAGLTPVMAYMLLRITVQLFITSQNPIHSLQRSFFSICYVALPLGLMSVICDQMELVTLLLVFIFLWINDSGAYLVGSTIGKHKFFERISPKKSWEGFWGGLVLTVIVAAFLGNVLFGGTVDQFPCVETSPTSPFLTHPMLITGGLGLVVSVFGTLGDLAESLIKRTAGVKDSSNLIPGHGGILDRIDSLLFAVPATLIYLAVIKYLL